jgi:hypothetical protein
MGLLDAVAEGRFDARHDAMVGPAARAPQPGRGTVRVVDDRPAEVALRADMTRGGLVVLNDAIDEGWTVRVDGRAAEAVRVNGVMRGVQVPRGSHEIRWSYRVPGLTVGAAISLAALAGMLAWACALVWRGRRRTTPSPVRGGPRASS